MPARVQWRCFHCGTTFGATKAGRRAAALHFGATDDTPTCKIEEWHQPLAKVIRTMAAMVVQHGSELRDAEEAGYAKALRDVKKLLVPLALNQEQWDRFIDGQKKEAA